MPRGSGALKQLSGICLVASAQRRRVQTFIEKQIKLFRICFRQVQLRFFFCIWHGPAYFLSARLGKGVACLFVAFTCVHCFAKRLVYRGNIDENILFVNRIYSSTCAKLAIKR